MRVRKYLGNLICAAAALGAVGSAGCRESPASPSNFAPFSQTDVLVGTGAEAAAGNLLTVHYTGWLYDVTRPQRKGLQFDTSAGTGGFAFTLGIGGVIAGWDQGLVGLKVGGLRRLVIPPSLGYGGVRIGPIPANSTLVFDVELLGVQ